MNGAIGYELHSLDIAPITWQASAVTTNIQGVRTDGGPGLLLSGKAAEVDGYRTSCTGHGARAPRPKLRVPDLERGVDGLAALKARRIVRLPKRPHRCATAPIACRSRRHARLDHDAKLSCKYWKG
jgi:hypothetical protein